MTTILEIQKLDAQKKKLLAGVENSKENKLLQQFTSVMKEGRNFIANITSAANEMITEYNDIANKYNVYVGKADITAKKKVGLSNLEHINELINESNSLASDCAVMEQRMRELTDKSTKLLNDYNVAMNQLKNTKTKQDTLKDIIAKMQANIQPQIEEIDGKITQLETKADKETLAVYKKMRDDNIFPIYVKLNGNRCGGCQMELPLSFIEKLKSKGKMPCEECHRIILFEDI